MNTMDQLEQRLGTALERIDYSLDQVAASGPRDDTQLAKLEEPAVPAMRDQAAQDVAAAPFFDISAKAIEDLEVRLAQARREAARLARANEGLREANRQLTLAIEADDQIEAIKAGYEAEAASLRAARSAEIAQLSDVLAALEALLNDRGGALEPSPEAGPNDGKNASTTGDTDAQSKDS